MNKMIFLYMIIFYGDIKYNFNSIPIDAPKL